jgi:hypothetical protein
MQNVLLEGKVTQAGPGEPLVISGTWAPDLRKRGEVVKFPFSATLATVPDMVRVEVPEGLVLLVAVVATAALAGDWLVVG